MNQIAASNIITAAVPPIAIPAMAPPPSELGTGDAVAVAGAELV